MIRLGSLAGYPFEGPRVLAGWKPPARPGVFAILLRPRPDARPQEFAVIYVGVSEDLSREDVSATFPDQVPNRFARFWVEHLEPATVRRYRALTGG